MRRGMRTLGVAFALTATACGPRLMKLPVALDGPALDAVPAFEEATAVCRRLSSFTADASLSGRLGGSTVRARLLVGFEAPRSARLEAIAFGRPLFVFVARGDTATILLQRDRQVVERASPAAILDALTGLPLDAADLRMTLTGCDDSLDMPEGRRPDDKWRILLGASRVRYLKRERLGAPWRLVAVVHRGGAATEWRADYSDFAEGLPRTVRLTRDDGSSLDLRISFSDLERNVPLEPGAFAVTIPPGVEPITLRELREASPLGGSR